MSLTDMEVIGVYLKCKEKAEDNNMDIFVVIEKFILQGNNKRVYGVFYSIVELWGFLCGYEWGTSNGFLNMKGGDKNED